MRHIYGQLELKKFKKWEDKPLELLIFHVHSYARIYDMIYESKSEELDNKTERKEFNVGYLGRVRDVPWKSIFAEVSEENERTRLS